MTRPASHQEQIPDRRCGNCRHAADVEYKQDLLCFHGDDVRRDPGQQGLCETVWLDGMMVGLMRWGEYRKVRAERIVDDTDICDCWEVEK